MGVTTGLRPARRASLLHRHTPIRPTFRFPPPIEIVDLSPSANCVSNLMTFGLAHIAVRRNGRPHAVLSSVLNLMGRTPLLMRRTPIGTLRAPVIGTLGAAVVCMLGWQACAQEPASDPAAADNPVVANCNMTPDTTSDPHDPSKRLAMPIDSRLLTLGQPCQQVVSTSGLTTDALLNMQRGFDFYSWLTFIALNTPADDKAIGHGPRPGGDAVTKWEALGNYRPLAAVMLEKGVRPTWGTRVVPELCKPLDGPDKIVLQLGEAAWNQPFKTGPLIDQNGNYALFDILVNKPMFDFVANNGLYSKQGQERFDRNITFPVGMNPDAGKPGRMGAVMLKVSWHVLDPDKDKAALRQFHTADALIYFPGPPATKTGPACVAKTLGLIGFHIGHKTKFAPQWVWSSFEHVRNAPSEKQVAARDLHSPYTFYNAACPRCTSNNTPPSPWDPPASLKFHSSDKSQVVRSTILPDSVAKEVDDLNRSFRSLLKGTVWENYMLITTQWPSNAGSKTDCNGAPMPTFLANTTLETYSQGQVPLASSSCMACHGNATTRHVPAVASDFTFILEKAQCENGICGPPVTNKSVAAVKQCGLADTPAE
jgi:hypothetical protein